MRIDLVEPDTTGSTSEKIAAAARSVAAAGTEIRAVSPARARSRSRAATTRRFCGPSLLEEIPEAEALGFDGHVIACFDDPGLDAARPIARGPVVGIAEAAIYTASLVAGSFTIATTLARSIPTLEQLVHRYGFARRCRRVRAAEFPVLALEEPGSRARERLTAEIGRALLEDRCEAILLGCAGMADLARELTAEFGLPVIDGVAAATRLVEAFLGLGLSTSEIGGWAAPLPEPYIGAFARFAPR